MRGISHSLTPPPDNCGDETQADNQGNDVDSYQECIQIQVISHQVSSLIAQDTTKLENQLACEDLLNNASPGGRSMLSNSSLKEIDPDQKKLHESARMSEPLPRGYSRCNVSTSSCCLRSSISLAG